MSRKESYVLVTMPSPSFISSPEAAQRIVVMERHFIEKLRPHQLTPDFVTGDMPDEEILEHFANSVGVIASGGTDIDPLLYGELPLLTTKKPDTNRDAMEIVLSRLSLTKKRPFLGICRGMQAVAVANGGRITQHLPDHLYETHGNSIDDPNPRDVFHNIIVDPDSLAFTIFGGIIFNAPSRHHQAVDNPGDLRVSGRSKGHVVEIIEADPKEHPFFLGLQTHPEITNNMDIVFEAFADATRRQKTYKDDYCPTFLSPDTTLL